jgi:hypothetical protein
LCGSPLPFPAGNDNSLFRFGQLRHSHPSQPETLGRLARRCAATSIFSFYLYLDLSLATEPSRVARSGLTSITAPRLPEKIAQGDPQTPQKDWLRGRTTSTLPPAHFLASRERCS